MATLRVRVYNVKFGDAILITVPDGGVTRHIVIDIGNVLSGAGGDDAVFKPVIEDIVKEIKHKTVDLYVMTHSHLDHIQGLLYASTKLFAAGEFATKLPIDFAWLTASAAKDYYDAHPKAKEKKDLYNAAWVAAADYIALMPADDAAPFKQMLANNNPRATDDCLEFLRGVAKKKTTYVHRELTAAKLAASHPFTEVKFELWAPEEDTSDYYGTFVPMALGVTGGAAGGGAAQLINLTPPPGVDAAAFYNLVDMRRRGLSDNLLAIDKAANNTSVVFTLEWRGWKLLFAGDAELRSWKTMNKQGKLQPVHFLKAAHHGSHNGTPDNDLLDKVLPPANPDPTTKRSVVISTAIDTYPGIPDQPTDDRLKARCDVFETMRKHVNDPFLDFTFEG